MGGAARDAASEDELSAQAEAAWLAHVATTAAELPRTVGGTALAAPVAPPARSAVVMAAAPPRRARHRCASSPGLAAATTDGAAAATTAALPAQPTTLRAYLRRHCLEEPIPLLAKTVASLEKHIGKAIARAEAAALAHPPFLAGLTEEGRRQLSESSGLRTLDVGCIRVDGADLWPDEAKEIDLQPYFAPMSLAHQLGGYAGEPSPEPPPSPTAARPAAGGAAIAHMLSFLKAVQR